MREVSRLVILDWLLSGTGERCKANAKHQPEVDRAQAKGILEGHREALRESLRRTVQQAYGAARGTPGTLAEDAAHDRTLVSLDPSLPSQPGPRRPRRGVRQPHRPGVHGHPPGAPEV